MLSVPAQDLKGRREQPQPFPSPEPAPIGMIDASKTSYCRQQQCSKQIYRAISTIDDRVNRRIVFPFYHEPDRDYSPIAMDATAASPKGVNCA
jgi:hypothetical protein